MAFDKGQVEVTVQVVAAQGAFLSADPMARTVDQGDPAIFVLTVSPKEGFAGPIYLRAINYSSSEKIFSVNPLPPGGGQSLMTLFIEPVGTYPIQVEAVDVLPEGEEIQ